MTTQSATLSRDAAAFEAAFRHSRRVRWLKRVLPAVSGLAFLWMAAGTLFSGSGPAIDLGEIVFSEEGLTMMAPRLSGEDDENRPYEVTAARATQSLDNPDVVSLEEIDARVALGAEGWARVGAARGRFDSQNRQLQLFDDILVRSSTGYEVRLEAADVDMQAGTLLSERPVRIDGPAAQLTADTVEMTGNGEVVTFRGRVRMTLHPSQAEEGEGGR
ncbi:MAG: LPS export ABC transporter periplasmic protein LptC [Hyphomicrobiaceae bacterium]|nr:LPS export ABC transporter periplasmic protein LptC [Hyphomicrobiaceae bacterium]